MHHLRAAVITGLVAAGVLAGVAAGRADACVRAEETNRLVGWSADGQYALLTLVDDKGAIAHAEIHPTSYRGSIYVITPSEEDGIVIVTKVKVGQCASFGDEDDTIVERKRGKLTEALLMKLKTVEAMKFGRAEVAAAPGAARATAAFTGAKRYAVHDLAVTRGAATTTLPIPVWCVGSCLRDEAYKKWTATVDAVHTLASGVVLYEVRLDEVCNGGTLIRLIAATPARTKVPRSRCRGSGE